MNISKETEQKIAKLQLLEQNLQNFLMQKQSLQTQLNEVAGAIEELNKSKGNVYKIVGNIMVASEKSSLEKDLNSKKELIELRIKNLEKQEEKIKEEATELQNEVLSKFKDEKQHQH